jgi:hypothetical protein
LKPSAVHSAIPAAPAPARMKFAVHGPAVEVECAVPGLGAQVRRLLGPFSVAGWPSGFVPVHGVVRPYEHADVMRHLSPAARPMARSQDMAELYEDGERFWVVDDRWGMAEINFLKGQWRSWLLPWPQFDPVRCAEMAVLWPLAQLLRPRGLCVLPAVSVVRDGRAALILCPFGMEPELTALVRAGYRIIGQRWTALREEDGRVAVLHMPGCVERSLVPRRRAADGTDGAAKSPSAAPAGWVDLNEQLAVPWQNHAFCDAVLVAEPGRRPHAGLRELDSGSAADLLRRAWPIVELHPSRRHGPLPARLAHLCRCGELRLSRDPGELLSLLDEFLSPETADRQAHVTVRTEHRNLVAAAV